MCYLQPQWDEIRTGRQAKPLKSLPGTHRDSIRAPCRSAGFGIASGGRLLFLRVSNFAQTADLRSANFPGDGRVAQSAERVCEQHETMVRTHSPAAILALGLTLNRPGRFKSTIFRYSRPCRESGRAK